MTENYNYCGSHTFDFMRVLRLRKKEKYTYRAIARDTSNGKCTDQMCGAEIVDQALDDISHEIAYRDPDNSNSYYVFRCEKEEKGVHLKSRPHISYCMYCGESLSPERDNGGERP